MQYVMIYICSLLFARFFNGRPLNTGSRIHMLNDFGFIALDMDYAYARDSGEYLCRGKLYGLNFIQFLQLHKNQSNVRMCKLCVTVKLSVKLQLQTDGARQQLWPTFLASEDTESFRSPSCLMV